MKSVPSQMNKMLNWVKVIRFFLWFHRLTGLTFGGLDIDSNGKISVNKFFKIYGILFFVLTVTYDIYQQIYTINSDFNQEISSNTALAAVNFLPLLISNVIYLLKWSVLFFLNIFGFKFFYTFVEGIQNQEMPRIGAKMFFVIMFWSIQMIAIALLPLNTPPEFRQTFQGVMSMVTFDLASVYGWSFAAIIWIVSIYYTAQLNQMAENLKSILPLKAGEDYLL